MKAKLYLRQAVNDPERAARYTELDAYLQFVGTCLETGVSGLSAFGERPHTADLLQECQREGVTLLLVPDWARLARSLSGLSEARHLLRQHGIESRQVDLDAP